MTTAGIILVVAWVPVWDVQSFEPFGYAIDTNAAIVIWAVMMGVLVYFTRGLVIGVRAELPAWQQHFSSYLIKFREGDVTPVPHAITRMHRRAVWIDKGLSLSVAAFSLLVGLSEVAQLLDLY